MKDVGQRLNGDLKKCAEIKKEQIENEVLKCTWCSTHCRGRRALMLHEQLTCQERTVPCPVMLQLGVTGCDGWHLPADVNRHEIFMRHIGHQVHCDKYKSRTESECYTCTYNAGERCRSDRDLRLGLQDHAKVCKARIPCTVCNLSTPLAQVCHPLSDKMFSDHCVMSIFLDRYLMVSMIKYINNWKKIARK